jgi:hypothetical protein
MRWLAATLTALLALAYALIVLASPSAEVRPAPDDTGLGGLSSLTKALKTSGYRVAFDPSTRPTLLPDDVVVAPVIEGTDIPGSTVKHVRSGGRAFVLGIPKDLQSVTEGVEVKDSTGRKAIVDTMESAPATPIQPVGHLATVTDWSEDGQPLSSLQQIGRGRLARLDSGALATNRFLPRHQNARVVLSSLGSVARKGDRLVFIADGYGEASSPGPIEALGPGAVGALWQLLIVLGTFGLVRGIRFGLPVPERASRRGSRELLDAVAVFYRRSKFAQAAVAATAKQHPEDAAIQAIAARPKLTEEEARRALAEFEARSKTVR